MRGRSTCLKKAVTGLLCLALSGCSTWAMRLPPNEGLDVVPKCTRAAWAPVVDTVAAGIYSALSALLLIGHNMNQPGRPGTGDALVITGAVVGNVSLIGSAVYGWVALGKCRAHLEEARKATRVQEPMVAPDPGAEAPRPEGRDILAPVPPTRPLVEGEPAEEAQP